MVMPSRGIEYTIVNGQIAYAADAPPGLRQARCSAPDVRTWPDDDPLLSDRGTQRPERVEREQFLRPLDPAQRIAANRDRPPAAPPASPIASAKACGESNTSRSYRPAHRQAMPADLVDRRAHHREIEPVLAADVPVEHLAGVGARARPRWSAAAASVTTPVELRRRGPGSSCAAAAIAPRQAGLLPDLSGAKIASVPSPISFSTSPPCSWTAEITVSA